MTRHCALCNTEEEDFTRHRESEEHRMNYLKYWFRTNQEELIKDKENVKVSCLNTNSCIPKVEIAIPIHVKKKIIFCIEVQNDDQALFSMYHFLNNMACSTDLSDEHEVFLGEACVQISDDRKYFVELHIRSDIVGVFVGAIAFQFMHDKGSKHFFHIVRVIEVKCEDQITLDSEPVEPYSRKRRYINIPTGNTIIRGRALDKLSRKLFRLERVVLLPEIHIPKDVRDVMHILELNDSTERIPTKLMDIGTVLSRVVSQDLHWTNYSSLFKVLLQFEKIQMDIDIRKYDMKNVVLDSCDQAMLELEVPGLAENRPSVLRGDIIYVRIVDEYKNNIDIEYEGFVHRVESTKVILGFGKDLILKHIKGTKYHVRFTYNLLPMKHMMLALDKVSRNGMETVLFPTHETAAQCILVRDPDMRFTFFNRRMEQNEEQALAVKQIVLGSSLPAPYLLFGPPGTGKTMTVTEAIKQVWKLFPDARILVCTPSNSASDLIAERLLEHIDSKDIIRFYSASRPWEKVPQKLKDQKCTNYDEFRKSYFYPSKTEIIAFKVVISTLVNSGRLVLADFPKNHFTHIVIDESGHSVEPEALIPISGLLHRKDINSEKLGGQLVLAGDPKQLGPTIRSSIAEKNGLACSILKRLMDKCEVYRKSEVNNRYNNNVLTKLVKNYRSHPDILHLPNLLFYDRELKVCADKLLRESLCRWEWLPKEGFPLIFHGVFGKDQREGKSPSYFNPQEVSVVIDYVQKLLDSKIKILAKDIGVISPYRQQVYKIKAQLRKLNFQDVSAGSVDEFQGQERKVIIISTVRSSTQLMSFDTDYRLGFIQHPERFNVAVTRAKALLIIVGNPKVLSKDFYWRSLLHFCIEKGSYTGVRYSMPGDEAAEIVESFSRLGLVPDHDEGLYTMPISQRAQQEDPQWRGEL